MNPFNWIRRLAADAVVSGVADGLRAVAPDGEAPADLDELRKQLAAAVQPKNLPAAADKKGKGEK